MKIHSYQRDNKQVPELRLIGVWMEQLGFNIGERVQITTRDRLLIIELLEEEAKEEVNYKAALQEVKQTLKKLSK
nr:SymE family type I addiction module toxin [uncultured Allomuricauda sp.]